MSVKECTEWIRQQYGAECKCIVTLRTAAISQDQAKTLPKDIEAIKSITQLAEVDGSRPFSRLTDASFGTFKLNSHGDKLRRYSESAASNMTFTGTGRHVFVAYALLCLEHMIRFTFSNREWHPNSYLELCIKH